MVHRHRVEHQHPKLQSARQPSERAFASRVFGGRRRDLIANVRLILRRQEPVAMTPWYRGFKGAVRPVENFPGKFEAMGVAQQKGRVRLEITELPVKRWTQDYKEWLVEQLPKSGNERRASITEMREYHSENSVHFSLSMTPDKLAEAERRGFEKTFHLRSTPKRSKAKATNPMAPPVLLVVGAAGAGKSSLVQRLLTGEPAPRPSVGIESGMFYSLQPEEAETSDLRRAVPLGGVGFEIMEIGGREPVHREIPRGRDVCGLMVCYDSRDRTSFFRLWHVLCRHRMDRHMEISSSDVCAKGALAAVLCGTKADLPGEPAIPQAEVRRFAEANGLVPVMTSAHSGQGGYPEFIQPEVVAVDSEALLEEEDVQPPDLQERKVLNQRLKYGLAALALLATLAVIGAGHRSEPSVAELKAQVQDWEQIPGIDEVVEHAKGLELQTPRHLEDLFYGSQPTELPWIRTECTIDVVQATAYLGQAVVFLYKSIDYPGLRCPDDSPAGCAASVAGFITSITWIASYLSFAANACGQSVRPAALCAGDWTALMANFGEMATVGAAVKEDCDFGKDWKSILDLEKEPETIPHEYWLHFEPKIDSEHRDTLLKWKGFQTAHRNRNFDVAQCVFDVTNSASYIVRAILQIRSAALACPEPRACAINIMNIISSFAWISQFTALAVSDCSKYGSQNALCAADISDMVAAVTNGPAAGVASTSDCADLPDPEDELHHLPMA
ncbi:unnamed protein product [Effrenium voratum]|uniref:DNA topoisomerase (ATP-hydrolyzing) n=1 Tax=Effrenium voratum TaxID=2562239 RepID=A0AA36J7J9_9DINO|nr:unnamed protein product [Effrenium voratum]